MHTLLDEDVDECLCHVDECICDDEDCGCICECDYCDAWGDGIE